MLKILSLFSGIGAYEKALARLDIPFEVTGYSEIDKYASAVYSAIHGLPETMNLGDITKINEKDLPRDIDLITYSAPCQDVSVAGRQKGLIDENGNKTRSGLVFDAVRIISEVKPKYAVAENVKGLVSRKFRDQFEFILSLLEEAGYNNYWKVLNAKDYGIPQSRERVFLVSIRKDIDDRSFEFPRPSGCDKKLSDFLEEEVGEKYYIPDKVAGELIKKDFKSVSLQATEDAVLYLPCMAPNRINKKQKGRRFKDHNEPMFTLTTQDRHGIMEMKLIRVGYIESDKQGQRVYSTEGVATTLSATGGGWGAKTGLYLFDCRIRRLTPLECWRLMGFDDDDYFKAKETLMKRFYNGKDKTDSQLYKMAGNSVVVNVLEAIFKNLFVLDGRR